jgi:hypothetical protein
MTLMVADLRASVRESDPEGKKQDAYIRDLKDRVVEVRCLRELREERLTQLRERGLVGEKEKLYTAAPHVAYIENTPNPASALAYYLNTRAGFIAPNCWLIPKYSGVTDQGPKDAIGKSLFARGELSPASLASLAKGNPHLQSVCRYLQAWGVPPESRLSWLSKQDQGWPPDFMKMIDACTLININDPVAFVKQICQLLDYIKTKHIDVRRLSGEDLDGLRDSFSHLFRDIAELSDVVSGRRPIEYRENVAIPKYERGELIDPTNKAEFDINTGNVVLLGGEHLVIAIGGSPNVGKSTFAASLAEALKAELARISQIPELGDIYLEVGLVDVDRATPVSSQLAEGRKMEEGPKKQSWNRALAAEAARELFKISKSANITVADFPGGKPDQITRALVGSVDAAVVLARENWEEIMPVWTSFFKEGGVPVIGKFRSHKMGDVTSAGHTIFEDGDLRTYNPGRFISGRVVGLERQLKPHDPLIVNTARLVLADLLPSMIGRRNQKRQNIVNGIKAAYGIE